MAASNDTMQAMALSPSMPPADGHCVIFTLPIELRKMVYGLGHARESNTPMKIESRSTWAYDEETKAEAARRLGQPHTSSSFVPYVERSVVNKQYCAEAYSTLVSLIPFNFHRGHNPLGSHFDESLFSAFLGLNTLTIAIDDLVYHAEKIVKYLPKLSRLHIIAEDREYAFFLLDDDHDNIMCDTVTKDTVHKMPWFAKLTSIKGCTEVEFVTQSSHARIDATKADQEKMQENIETIKSTMQKSLMRQRKSAGATHEP